MSSFAVVLRRPQRWLDEHRLLLQRAAIVLGVLGLSALFARGVSLSLVAALIVLPIGVAGMLAVLRWPQLGLVGLVPVSLLLGFGSDNMNPTVLAAVGLLGLWFFTLFLLRRPLRLPVPSIARPLIFLLAWAVVAFVIGLLPWFPTPQAPIDAQIGGLMVFVISAGIFLMAATLINDLRWLQALVFGFLALGAVYIVTIQGPRPLRFIAWSFPWGATSCLFYIWLVAHSFSQAAFNRRLHPALRAGLGLLCLYTLYLLFVMLYDWKSGWIPAFTVIGVILALNSPRMAIVMGLAGLVAAPFVVADLLAGDEYSYLTRMDALVLIFQMIMRNPISGLGMANYYHYTPLFPIRGYAVNFNSHNQYVDLVAQTGVIGLGLYLWFFVELALFSLDLWRRRMDDFSRAYVNACIGGLAAMVLAGLLGDWVLPFVYNVGLVGMRSSLMGWLFLGGMVALAQIWAPTWAAQDWADAGEAAQADVEGGHSAAAPALL